MEKKVSFEEKLSNLEKIVKDLESGEVPLDDAINKFNEAMSLAGDLNKTLENASQTINKVLNKDGSETTLEIKE